MYFHIIGSWTVVFQTGATSTADANPDIYLILFDAGGPGLTTPLLDDAANNFEPGRTDRFSFALPSTAPYKIYVWSPDTFDALPWNLYKVSGMVRSQNWTLRVDSTVE